MPNCLELLLPFCPSAPARCQASLALSPLPTTLQLLDPGVQCLLPGSHFPRGLALRSYMSLGFSPTPAPALHLGEGVGAPVLPSGGSEPEGAWQYTAPYQAERGSENAKPHTAPDDEAEQLPGRESQFREEAAHRPSSAVFPASRRPSRTSPGWETIKHGVEPMSTNMGLMDPGKPLNTPEPKFAWA